VLSLADECAAQFQRDLSMAFADNPLLKNILGLDKIRVI